MVNNLNDHKYNRLDISLLLFFVIIIVGPMKDPFLLSGSFIGPTIIITKKSNNYCWSNERSIFIKRMDHGHSVCL